MNGNGSRPVIGLTSDVRKEKRTLGFSFSSYYESVDAAGGLPILIPPLCNTDRIPEVLALLDGVVIVGGEDLDPRLYKEEPLSTQNPVPAERERFDLEFARTLFASEMPVLGICYGCQVLAVVSGGSLWQDIPTQVPGSLEHAGRYPDLPFHEIAVEANTRLHGILGTERLKVNSAHHQAPKALGDGLVVTARSSDDVIEAFEAPGDRFLIGAEWHPDLMGERPGGGDLFRALVEAAEDRRR